MRLDDIKELAQYVTEVDYDQGAVKEVIVKICIGGRIMGYKLIACDLDETLLNDEHLVGAKKCRSNQKSPRRIWREICSSYRTRIYANSTRVKRITIYMTLRVNM